MEQARPATNGVQRLGYHYEIEVVLLTMIHSVDRDLTWRVLVAAWIQGDEGYQVPSGYSCRVFGARPERAARGFYECQLGNCQ
jgi:hypothetical protein